MFADVIFYICGRQAAAADTSELTRAFLLVPSFVQPPLKLHYSSTLDDDQLRLLANDHADAPRRGPGAPPTPLLIGCAVEVWQRLHLLFPRAVETQCGSMFLSVVHFFTGHRFHWSAAVAKALQRLVRKYVGAHAWKLVFFSSSLRRLC